MAKGTTIDRLNALEGEIEALHLQLFRADEHELSSVDDIAGGNCYPMCLQAAGENEESLARAILELRRPSRATCDPERCDWARRPNHDALVWMLAAESPHATECTVREVVGWDEMVQRSDAIRPLDWPDFVREHNWPDPAATSWIAICCRELYEDRAARPDPR